MATILGALAITAVVVTKAADLWTTWRHVGASAESNPVGRVLFRALGVPGGLAIIGVVSLAIVAVTWSVAFALGEGAVVFLAAWSFAIAAVQAAVAHHNATGRSNRITRRVAAFHAAWTRAACPPSLLHGAPSTSSARSTAALSPPTRSAMHLSRCSTRTKRA